MHVKNTGPLVGNHAETECTEEWTGLNQRIYRKKRVIIAHVSQPWNQWSFLEISMTTMPCMFPIFSIVLCLGPGGMARIWFLQYDGTSVSAHVSHVFKCSCHLSAFFWSMRNSTWNHSSNSRNVQESGQAHGFELLCILPCFAWLTARPVFSASTFNDAITPHPTPTPCVK